MSSFCASKIATSSEIADIQIQQGQKCCQKYTFRDRKKVQRNLEPLNFDKCLRKPDKRRLGGWFLKEKQKYLRFLQQNFYTQFKSISQYYDEMALSVRTRNSQQVKIFHQKNMIKYSGIENVIKMFRQIVQEKIAQRTKISQKQEKGKVGRSQQKINMPCNQKVNVQNQNEMFPFVSINRLGGQMPFYYPMSELPRIQEKPFLNSYSISMYNSLIMEQIMAAKRVNQAMTAYQLMGQNLYPQQIHYQMWNSNSNFSPINPQGESPTVKIQHNL